MRFPLAERCSGAAMRMIRKLLESYLAWLCKVFQVMPDSLGDGRAREPPTPVRRDQFALARSITSCLSMDAEVIRNFSPKAVSTRRQSRWPFAQ